MPTGLKQFDLRDQSFQGRRIPGGDSGVHQVRFGAHEIVARGVAIVFGELEVGEFIAGPTEEFFVGEFFESGQEQPEEFAGFGAFGEEALRLSTDPVRIDACAAYDARRTNRSTARDMTRLLSAIWTNDAAPPEACASVRAVMARQYSTRIGQTLPAGARLLHAGNEESRGDLSGVLQAAGLKGLKFVVLLIAFFNFYPGINNSNQAKVHRLQLVNHPLWVRKSFFVPGKDLKAIHVIYIAVHHIGGDLVFS